MGDFSQGGVHKTDRLRWAIFQRGEYTKPTSLMGDFSKGQQSIRDCSRLSDLFVNRALGVGKNHERRS